MATIPALLLHIVRTLLATNTPRIVGTLLSAQRVKLWALVGNIRAYIR